MKVGPVFVKMKKQTAGNVIRKFLWRNPLGYMILFKIPDYINFLITKFIPKLILYRSL